MFTYHLLVVNSIETNKIILVAYSILWIAVTKESLGHFFLFSFQEHVVGIVEINKKNKKKIQKGCGSQKPLTGSEIRVCLKNRLTGTRKKPVLNQQWLLGLEKKTTSLLLQVGKTTCRLSGTLAHSLTSSSLYWTYILDSGHTFKLKTHWNDSPVISLV